jgi:hypothetical protein
MRPGETPGVIVAADTNTLLPLVPHGIFPKEFIPLESGMVETVSWYQEATQPKPVGPNG